MSIFVHFEKKYFRGVVSWDWKYYVLPDIWNIDWARADQA